MKLLKFFLALALTALVFGLGIVTAIYLGLGRDDVTIEVHNRSGARLAFLVLEYQSCGQAGSISSAPVAEGGRYRFRYSACGESGYRLVAQFPDGRRMESHGGYAESGYAMTETVTPGGIVLDSAAHRP